MVALSAGQQRPIWRDFSGLRSRVDCQKLAESLFGHEGKAAGRGRQYSNPQREQSSPSFTVYPGSGGYTEFSTSTGVKASGDVYDLIIAAGQARDRLDAYDWLAAREGYSSSGGSTLPALQIVTLSQQQRSPASIDPDRVKLPVQSWQDKARQLAIDGQALLFLARFAGKLDYLRKRINPTGRHAVATVDQLIRDCRIGYLDKWTDSGLFTADGKPRRFQPGLLFPYWEDQTLPAVQCRPDNPQPGKKYIFQPGSAASGHPLVLRGLFNPDAPTIIVEGVIKGMAAALELPAYNVIVTGSTSFALPASMIERLRTAPVVYLAMDTDDNGAGQRANAALAAAIDSDNLREVILPFGKDIDGFIALGGDLVMPLDMAKPVSRPPKPVKLVNDPALHLPDSWRAVLNEYAPDAVTPVIELCYALRRTQAAPVNAAYSINDLVDAADALGWQTSRKTVTKGLNEGARRGLFVCQQTDIDRPGRPASCYRLVAPNDLQTLIAALAEPIIVARLFSAGDDSLPLAPVRAAYVEGLITSFNDIPLDTVDDSIDALALETMHNDAAMIAAELDTKYGEQLKAQPGYRELLDQAALEYGRLIKRLNNMASSPLPDDWTIKNSKQYRAAQLHAVALTGALPQQPKSYQIETAMGVSKGAVKTLYAAAGIKVSPAYKELIIRDQMALSNLASGWDKAADGFLHGIEVDGTQYTPKTPGGRQAAEQAIAEGKPVKAVYQQASKLEIVHKAQPTEADIAAERKPATIDPAALLSRIWRNRRAIDDLKTRLIASTFDQYFGGPLYPDLTAARDTLTPIVKKGLTPDTLPTIAETAKQACSNAESALRQYHKDTHGAGLKSPDMTPGGAVWCKRWSVGLITHFTSWQRDEQQLTDSATGEIVGISLASILAILRGLPLPEHRINEQAFAVAELGVKAAETLAADENKPYQQMHKAIVAKHLAKVNHSDDAQWVDYTSQASKKDGVVWDHVLQTYRDYSKADSIPARPEQAAQQVDIRLTAAKSVPNHFEQQARIIDLTDLAAIDRALSETRRQALRMTGNGLNAVRAALATLDSATKAALLTAYPGWSHFAEVQS